MSDYTELQKAAAYAAKDTIKFADEDGEMRALQQFHEEVDPETVLALIAENDRLERKNANQSESIREYQDLVMGGDVSLGMLKADIRVTTGERDQLRAEVASLRTGYEAYERVNAELKAEVGALREEVALDDKIIADRDRLLNMFDCPAHGQCIPYAMEQIEALRKDADRLQSATAFVQKLCDYAGKQPRVATGRLHDILAALGQGEQP